MKKYRRLGPDEVVTEGDVWTNDGDGRPEAVKACGSDIGRTVLPHWKHTVNAGNCYGWHREVKESNWVSYSDRIPTKDDAYGSPPKILVKYQNGSISLITLSAATPHCDFSPTKDTYWMALNFISQAPDPVKVDGKTLIPMSNGDVKISCGTVVPSKDVDELIRQRAEVMKA